MLFTGLLNPCGINARTYIFRSYRVEAINNHINEMATLTVHDLLGKITFCYLVIIFLTYIIKGKDQVKIKYLLLLLGTSYLSLSTIKGISYLIIAAILSLSYLLKDTLKIKPEKEQYSEHHKIYYLIIVLSALIIIGIDYSKRDLNYIPELKDGLNKVLAQYNQEDILLEYFDLIDKSLNYEEFIAKYNFTHILVDETKALYKYMETENNYELFYKVKLYQKKTYKIYVRKDLIKQ